MKIDLWTPGDILEIGDSAFHAESLGFDGLTTPEIANDPFLPLALAAERTKRVQLGTSIAVAFVRSPMVLAQTSWDLQRLSGGRFALGLGPQIRTHVVKRFGMPYSHPAARMKEYVGALRAIWSCWQNGTGLDFHGEFFQLSLMTRFFNPGPINVPPPRVLLAAVGPTMTRTAAEVADGVICSYTTARSLKRVLPIIEKALADSGRTREEFEIVCPAVVATGSSDEEMEAAIDAVRQQIAFMASTPAYRGVLELHGWGDVQSELHELSKRDAWGSLSSVIDDEILNTFAIVGEPSSIGDQLAKRYDNAVDRFGFHPTYEVSAEVMQGVVDGVHRVQDGRISSPATE